MFNGHFNKVKLQNESLSQIHINSFTELLEKGKIKQLRPFTQNDGFLLCDISKGSLIYVRDNNGNLWRVAEFTSKKVEYTNYSGQLIQKTIQ